MEVTSQEGRKGGVLLKRFPINMIKHDANRPTVLPCMLIIITLIREVQQTHYIISEFDGGTKIRTDCIYVLITSILHTIDITRNNWFSIATVLK